MNFDELHPWTVLISSDGGIVRVQEFGLGLEPKNNPIELKLQVIDSKEAHVTDFYVDETRWQEIKALVDSHLEEIRVERAKERARPHREEYP